MNTSPDQQGSMGTLDQAGHLERAALDKLTREIRDLLVSRDGSTRWYGRYCFALFKMQCLCEHVLSMRQGPIH